MAEISAAVVKSLRERTGLPMMDCKRALEEAGGDQDKAIEALRKAGAKTMEKRAGRETSFGRVAVVASLKPGIGAMIELRCESAPVAGHEEFVGLANNLVQQLATGPGAATPEELLAQPTGNKKFPSLKAQFDDLNHRIREVFVLARIVRINAPCGGYVHHNGNVGVLLEVEGGTADLAKDICMHIAALRPPVVTREELDPTLVAKEREILSEAARREGKPEKIIEKMVEGRMKNFYAEKVLLDQPFVKDEKQSVGDVAKAAGMKIVRFVHWEVGKE